MLLLIFNLEEFLILVGLMDFADIKLEGKLFWMRRSCRDYIDSNMIILLCTRMIGTIMIFEPYVIFIDKAHILVYRIFFLKIFIQEKLIFV